ncbi:hypothetical protein SNOG_02354 [Parastagonospora nodorum SN15]|uniref:Uncharacterized protein n=1 Tax=Phaeosphaeria nodorum (strain SN15 / ATCC MYA-4574 / FGSC 10173) TaxID=321614 RepID=Q0V0W0_PHANO|nr:hypothetical protein SNOG_02354 [Parastagonospora nodorum SN15]EAT90566.1 hypothetical protein SNOG_02354 [Parastagonospora nodorum SN15]
MAMPKSSICFREAYDLRTEGRIQLEEYLKHIVAHYEGMRHETDAEGNRPFLYAGFEDEVRKIVLGKDFEPLNEGETALVYSIFVSAFQGNFSAVQELLSSSMLASETYLCPLVEIAKETGECTATPALPFYGIQAHGLQRVQQDLGLSDRKKPIHRMAQCSLRL